jgi:hypothetical protein
MKNHKVNFVVFFILMFISCSTKQIINDLNNEKIKGNVKTIVEIVYNGSLKFGDFQKQGYKNVKRRTFNRFGNVIEEFETGLNLKQIKKYNEKELLIEIIAHNSNGSLFGITRYKYDDKNRLIEQSEIGEKDTLISKSILKYNDKGNQEELSSYKSDGLLYDKVILKYDEKDRVIEQTYHFSPTNSDTKTILIYKDIDTIIEMKYMTNGGLDQKTIYKRDKNKNVIGIDVYNSYENLIKKTTYKYDNLNHLILINTHNTDTFLSTAVGSIKDVTTYKYTFDTHGNWIQIDEFTNYNQTGKTERVITYY